MSKLAKLTCITLLLLSGHFIGQNSLAQGTVTQESQQQEKTYDTGSPLIALFIYNFVNFVEWPAPAFEQKTSPINACWYGSSKASQFLKTLHGTPVGDRELHITISEDVQSIKTGCHLLFIEESRKAVLPDFWKNINYMFVLSIGEQEEFTEKGGIIRIVRTADQLEFEANVHNARGAGVFLSSDLLHLARKIKGLNSAQ